MTTITKSDFTLTGIKTFKGMEGMGGFNAILHFKGKPIAECINDDCGGMTMVRYYKPSDEEMVGDFCKAQPPIVTTMDDPKESGKKFQYDFTDETLIDDLINAHFAKKEQARLARALEKAAAVGVAFRLVGDAQEGFREIKWKSPIPLEKRLEYVRNKYGAKLAFIYDAEKGWVAA